MLFMETVTFKIIILKQYNVKSGVSRCCCKLFCNSSDLLSLLSTYIVTSPDYMISWLGTKLKWGAIVQNLLRIQESNSRTLNQAQSPSVWGTSGPTPGHRSMKQALPSLPTNFVEVTGFPSW